MLVVVVFNNWHENAFNVIVLYRYQGSKEIRRYGDDVGAVNSHEGSQVFKVERIIEEKQLLFLIAIDEE